LWVGVGGGVVTVIVGGGLEDSGDHLSSSLRIGPLGSLSVNAN